ncbi:FAD/NAD(P)-binding protein [Granulosicoccus antarcticus]|uniref:FAD-dependent urate hydroxylase HpyO/Asp monooxygenase CreE-like FAD/NAD(P)-binding domain-containing protein n=1 Tax=Granulosicoccus antarcticus IMCC3135 TaxID=1192854 RepID=A0A2Z2NQJ5_9GAMM|nr:FAD/NAD(P)-binding protein [Granulosicoccus antarcticus]ASJ73746.1 hypothetical protein IMCC3135_18335 [Granulosicoccus antarcticus IMCC3135]
MLRKRVGIVGCGAMGLYTLKRLLESRVALTIELFESEAVAGTGMPYRNGMNADYMLCNAFSREIPSLTRSLVHWLETQPARELSEWEISSDDISARAFYPRLLIGEFLQAEFMQLCELAECAGHQIKVHSSTKVIDLVVERESVTVIFNTEVGKEREISLDTIVIATGHLWPKKPSIDQAQLLSPWPYTQITQHEPGRIGILGSSLSAVDIVIALGHAHGEFIEQGEHVLWVAGEQACDLRVTMVSRNGIMPEADFFYPFPYEPLTRITQEAVCNELEYGSNGLLWRVFKLLLDELDAADPGYLKQLGPDARTIEGFSSAYFRGRKERGGLDAVRQNLQEVRASMRCKETIAHRYVLLRGHEHFELVLAWLDAADWQCFKQHLLPVFADCYAALPHLSVARVLAMHQAGVLTIVASGEDSSFTSVPSGEVLVEFSDQKMEFDAMFDARGQSSASPQELLFPSLTQNLLDGESPLLKPFRLDLSVETSARIYCLALPQVLERYPFSQGLPNCSDLSKQVVSDILEGFEISSI